MSVRGYTITSVIARDSPGETTGGAVIQAPTNPTLTLDTPYDFTLTLGPNPGGSGTITVDGKDVPVTGRAWLDHPQPELRSQARRAASCRTPLVQLEAILT